VSCSEPLIGLSHGALHITKNGGRITNKGARYHERRYQWQRKSAEEIAASTATPTETAAAGRRASSAAPALDTAVPVRYQLLCFSRCVAVDLLLRRRSADGSLSHLRLPGWTLVRDDSQARPAIGHNLAV
jgi:hypothetical protein